MNYFLRRVVNSHTPKPEDHTFSAVSYYVVYIRSYFQYLEAVSSNRNLLTCHTVKMDLREIGWGGMDWIDLTQDRDQWRALVNKVVNLRIP
jgi:hypothetical protein